MLPLISIFAQQQIRIMIVYGASGHGKVIIEILENINTPNIEIWDDADRAPIWEYPVKKPFHTNGAVTDKIVISIGANSTRKKVAERLASAKVAFGTAIHS